LNTLDAILAHNKIITQQLEALTTQMAKLSQQLQEGQFFESQNQPIRCDFCEGDHPNGHYCYKNNSSEAKVNYMSNQGRQGGFSNNKNYPQGWRIKILDGNKMLVHLTSKDLFNKNNNHYILQFQKD